MQSDGICATGIESIDADTLIPVEILSCDISQRSRSHDASRIVELGKKLLSSAERGDSDTVRDLMCKGAPFTTNGLGTSALHLAAQNNHTETAEILLKAGISRDAKTKVDRTPLHMAAYEGHLEMVQLLLNYGANVDSRDMLKMTPLHWAVEREHLEIIHVLLDYGADTNASSKFNKTPISLALEHGRLDIVHILQQERELLPLERKQATTVPLEVPALNVTQLNVDKEQVQQLHLQGQQFQTQKKKNNTAPIAKKQRMFFQPIQITSDDEQEKELEKIDDFNNGAFVSNKNHKDISDLEVDQPLRFLQAHGITFQIPAENDSIVENAMESGGRVVLTEAGKLALNLTKTTPLNLKRLQMGSRRGTTKKVIAIRADQILGQNASNLTTSRGPNILKRNPNDNKTGKVYLATSFANNTQGIPQFFQTKNIPLASTNKTFTKVKEPVILHIDDDIEEITEEDNNKLQDKNESEGTQETDIAVVSRQLAEARRQIEEYRKQLQKKEEEVIHLRNIVAMKTAK